MVKTYFFAIFFIQLRIKEKIKVICIPLSYIIITLKSMGKMSDTFISISMLSLTWVFQNGSLNPICN